MWYTVWYSSDILNVFDIADISYIVDMIRCYQYRLWYYKWSATTNIDSENLNLGK